MTPKTEEELERLAREAECEEMVAAGPDIYVSSDTRSGFRYGFKVGYRAAEKEAELLRKRIEKLRDALELIRGNNTVGELTIGCDGKIAINALDTDDITNG
jgi:predicted DNA-binding protein (UPF0278 family)